MAERAKDSYERAMDAVAAACERCGLRKASERRDTKASYDYTYELTIGDSTIGDTELTGTSARKDFTVIATIKTPSGGNAADDKRKTHEVRVKIERAFLTIDQPEGFVFIGIPISTSQPSYDNDGCTFEAEITCSTCEGIV